MAAEGVDFEAEGLLVGLESDDERAERLELLRELAAAGVPLERLREAAAEDRLALLPAELAVTGGQRYTLAEVAEKTALDPEFLARDWLALGLPRPRMDEPVYAQDDLEATAAVAAMLQVVSEEEFLELARIVGESSARIADALLHMLGNALIRAGDSERTVGLRYAQITRELGSVIGPLLATPLRLHLREVMRREVVDRAAREAGQLPGTRPVAVCFADLVGFTALGQRAEPARIGSVASRLARIAGELAAAPVRLVRTIGDAVMLVSPEADALAQTALRLVERVEQEDPDFPSLRAGIAHGPALARWGDWYGHPVNLASRVTAAASPASVVATGDVVALLADGWAAEAIGPHRLKGVTDEVTLFTLRRT